MNEQSKATKRRKLDPRFTNRWFVGKGIDIGCGPDPLSTDTWPKITEVVSYDIEINPSADAQYMADVEREHFDFVHSSHCLEHIKNTRAALVNWLELLKPGGFIVCTVPEEFLYEYGRWPSRWNSDHKTSFTMRSMPIMPHSQHVSHLLWKLGVDIEHLTLLTDHWDPAKAGLDQTLGDAECAIEFVVRKPDLSGKLPF